MRSLEQVTDLYTCVTEVQISERLVEDDALRRYSSALRGFHLALGESAGDDQWRDILRRLRRIHFDTLAAPVAAEPLECDELHAFLSAQRQRVRAAIPSVEPMLGGLLDTLQGLWESSANPLLAAIGEIDGRSEGSPTPVLLSESRLRQPSQVAMEQAGFAHRVLLLTPPELRASSPLDSLVIVGAPRWFPQHVFTAPRAANLVIVRHHWVSADWKDAFRPSFQMARSERAQVRREPPVIHRDRASVDVAPGEEAIPALEVRPLEDIERPGHAGWATGRLAGEEEVDAVMLKLDGANVVLLEDEEGNQAYIVDLDEDDPIHRVPVRDVAEGVFILLRTEGAGDYVVDMANQLLGTEAFAVRARQELWKQGLREAVTARGVEAVVAELRRLGSRRANASNLRNWQSPRSIKTKDRADFDAILALVELDHERDDMWQTMDLIDRAHAKAGQEIRRRLLAEVERADRAELIRHGRLEVKLDEGGGLLAAFRVEEVSRQPHKALRSQLNQVLSSTQPRLAP